MTLKQLKCFVALVKHKNFTAAAAEVCLTQPAMSTAIKTLESQFSAKLIERDGNSSKFSITDMGAYFATRAVQIILMSEKLEKEMK
jgi:DNA-binding transcriptional LysR family regulator